MPVSRDQTAATALDLPCISQLLQKVRAQPPWPPILSQDPAAPGGPLEGLCLRVSWFTAAGGCPTSSSVCPGTSHGRHSCGHHTGRTHTLQAKETR